MLHSQVGKIRDDQDRDSNNLAGLSADIDDAKAYIDKQWKEVHDQIKGEGDLFAKVRPRPIPIPLLGSFINPHTYAGFEEAEGRRIKQESGQSL